MSVSDQANWRRFLDAFVADLGVGEDRLPLERVLRRHAGVFQAILATGRTWPQIAHALTQAGARHKRGQPMSAKQLRTVYGRVRTAAAKPALHGRVAEQSNAAAPVALFATDPVNDYASSRAPKSQHAPSARSPSLTSQNLDGAGERVLARLAEARKTREAVKYEFNE